MKCVIHFQSVRRFWQIMGQGLGLHWVRCFLMLRSGTNCMLLPLGLQGGVSRGLLRASRWPSRSRAAPSLLPCLHRVCLAAGQRLPVGCLLVPARMSSLPWRAAQLILVSEVELSSSSIFVLNPSLHPFRCLLCYEIL